MKIAEEGAVPNFFGNATVTVRWIGMKGKKDENGVNGVGETVSFGFSIKRSCK